MYTIPIPRPRLAIWLIPVLLLTIQVGWSAPPRTMSYQGILTDDIGTAVADSSYTLTFKLWDAATDGNQAWTETQTVTTVDGLFNVILGAVYPLDVPFDVPYWLGITVNGGTELAPRTALTSSPYSLNAGATHSLTSPDGSVADALIVNNDGHVGVGTLTPEAALHVTGDVAVTAPQAIAVIANGENGITGLDDPNSIFVAGNRAYVASRVGASLTILDVADPAHPVFLGEARDSVNGFTALNGANNVFVVGTRAYVTAGADDSLTIIDVSTPDSPFWLAQLVDDNAGVFNALDGANRVFVVNNVAYVAATNDDAVTIINVAQPVNPQPLAVLRDGDGVYSALDGPTDVFVANNIAYMTSVGDDSLTIVNVANPAAPVLLAEVRDGDGVFSALDGANSVYVDGTKAYVTGFFDGALTIVNVADPANPHPLAEMREGVNGLPGRQFPRSIRVHGTTAYMASALSDEFTIIDVANPSAPRVLFDFVHGQQGFTALDGASSVFVVGTIAYVTAGLSDALTVIDLTATKNVDLVVDHNVGIGTTTPHSKLEVAGTIHSTAGGIKFPDGSVQLSAADGHSLDSADGSVVDAVLVDDVGRVGMGVGLGAPQGKLDIGGGGDIRTGLDIAPGGCDTLNRVVLAGSPNLTGIEPGDVLVDESGNRRFQITGVDDVADILTISGTIACTEDGTNDARIHRNGLIVRNGNVGIGNTVPRARLEVVGDQTTSATTLVARANSTGPIMEIQNQNTANTSNVLTVTTNGAGRAGEFRITSTTNTNPALYSTTQGTGPAAQFDGRVQINGNLGIGTVSPTAKLHIGGTAGTDGIRFPDGTLQTTADGGGDLWSQSGSNIHYSAGNVGIGANNPTQKLDVVGTVKATAFVGDGSGLTGLAGGTGGVENAGSTTIGADAEASPDGVGEIALQTRNMTRVTVANDGNVGVGTTSPQARLHAGDGNWILGSSSGMPGFGTSGYLTSGAGNLIEGGGGGWGLHISNYGSGDIARFGTSGGRGQSPDNKVVVKNNGSVGIGTTNPSETLQIGGDVRIGLRTEDNGSTAGYGSKLHFSGGDDWSDPEPGRDSDNTDPLWIARYNAALDKSELRINIGDNDDDSFVVGRHACCPPNQDVWNPFLTVKTNGRVGIGTTNPETSLHIVADDEFPLIAERVVEDAGGPLVQLRKSRGAVGAKTAVTTGDFIGHLSYDGWDGTTYVRGASIWGKVDGAVSTGNVPGRLEFYAGGPTERMRIAASGNVGIGTLAPAEKLDVTGNVRATKFIGDGSQLTNLPIPINNDWTATGGNIFRESGFVGIGTETPTQRLDVNGNVRAVKFIGDGSMLTNVSAASDNDWIISGNNIYRETGNIGIGTASPATALDVAGTVTATAFVGDGSQLTGITGATGGVANPGSTTIGADTDSANGGEIALQTQNTTRMTVVSNGNVGVGTTTPETALHVTGGDPITVPQPVAIIQDGAGGFTALDGALSIFVSGTTAYVASTIDRSLTIIDVVDPANPQMLAELIDGANGFNALNGAGSVFVAGTTAYVAAGADNALSIIDVTTPSSPQLLAEIFDNNSDVGRFDRLAGPFTVFVADGIAYVAAFADDALTMIDVSTPSNPQFLAQLVDGDGEFDFLDGVGSVAVSGDTAFITAVFDDALTIVDVADPANPQLRAVLRDSINGFNRLDGANRPFIAGHLAYVPSTAEDSVTIIDVADPANPVLVTEIVNGVNGIRGLDGARSVYVDGTTAYVVASVNPLAVDLATGSLAIIDVTDPVHPGMLFDFANGQDGFTALSGASSVFVVGATAYVVANSSDALTIVDLAATRNVDLYVENNVGIGTATPQSKLEVAGTIHVTKGGIKFADGTVQTSATDGHSLDSADGSFPNALLIDDAGKVGIGQAVPQGKVDIAGGGDIRTGLDIAPGGCGTPNRVVLAGSPNLAGITAGDIFIDEVGNRFVINSVDDPADTIMFATAGSVATCTEGTAPAARIHRNGLIVRSGNVGIGQAVPSAKLTLNGIGGNTAFGNSAVHIQEANRFFDFNGGLTFRGSGTGFATQFTATSNMNDTGDVLGIYREETAPGTPGAQIAVFKNSGNVGIGTTNPTAKLHIGGAAGTDGIRFPDGTLQTTAGGGGPWSQNGANINYGGGGNVGIGTTNPQAKLDVAGNIRTNFDTGRVLVGHQSGGIESGGAIRFYADIDNNGDDNYVWYDNEENEVMTIKSDGNVMIGEVTASDSKFYVKQVVAAGQSSTANGIRVSVNGSNAANTGTHHAAVRASVSGNAGDVAAGLYDAFVAENVQANGGSATYTGLRIRTGYTTAIQIQSGDVEFFGQGRITAQQGLTLAVNGAERLRIADNGNIGIGTTNPLARMHMGDGNWIIGNGADMPGFGTTGYLTSDAGNLIEGGGGGWGIHFSNYRNGDIARFGTSGGRGQEPDTKVVVSNTGNVGIGVSNPFVALQVRGGDNNSVVHGLEGINSQGTLTHYSNTNVPTEWNVGVAGNSGWMPNGTYVIDEHQQGVRVAIEPGGNVGIGTPNPEAKLHIGGTPGTDGIMFPDGTLQTTAGGGQWAQNGTDIHYDGGSVGVGPIVSVDSKFHVQKQLTIGASGRTNGINVTLDGSNTANTGAHNIAVNARLVGNPGDEFSGAYDAFVAENVNANGGSGRFVGLRIEAGYTTAIEIQSGDVEFSGQGHIHAHQELTLAVGGAERLRIANDGNVGIGTANPGAKLHIAGNLRTDGEVVIDSGGARPLRLVSPGTGDGIYLHIDQPGDAPNQPFRMRFQGPNGTACWDLGGGNSSGDFQIIRTCFDPQDTVVMHVDRGSLNVGIGTTNPTAKLHVEGPVKSSFGFQFPDGSTQTTAASGDGHSLNSQDGSVTDAVFVDSLGRVGVGTTSPGAKLHVNGEAIFTAGTVSGDEGKLKYVSNGADGTYQYFDGDEWKTLGTGNVTFSGTLWQDSGGGDIHYNGGRVGIGVANAQEKLQIQGGNVRVNADATTNYGSFVKGVNVNISQSNGRAGIALHTSGAGIAYMGYSSPELGDGDMMILGTDHSGNDIGFFSDLGSQQDVDNLSLAGKTPIVLFKGNGNVGIGTQNPETPLDIAATGIGVSLTVRGASRFDNNIHGGPNNMLSLISTRPNDGNASHIQFITSDGATGQQERMRIAASGNVGIGISSPTAKLDVNGAVKAASFSGDGAGLTNLPAANLTGAITSTQLAAGAAAANLNAANQSGVASGGVVLSFTENAALVSAGYVRLGGTMMTADTWRQGSNSTPPAARANHTAVWTGSEMIVWGGFNASNRLNDGGRYSPAGHSWTPVSTAGAPSARELHTAVWTGSEMIIWGGSSNSYLGDGSHYNPTTDSWTAVSTTGAPSARNQHTAVWTGSEMIVWGGYNDSSELNDGSRYNPVTDSWTAMSTNGAPAPRRWHTAVWTGSEMIVWGGDGGSGNYLGDGSRYNPGTDSWTTISTAGAPTARYSHTAVWTGSEMIVWGGYGGSNNNFNDGSRYNPANNSWTAVSSSGANGRRYHTAAWTGSEMIVWGGIGYGGNNLNDGSRYNSTSNSWTTVSSSGAPSARYYHTAVWTGSEMIVWAGFYDDGINNYYFNDTLSYTPGRTLYLYQRP